MHVFRRAAVAVGIGAVVATVLRLRGLGGIAPQEGGWVELEGPDYR